MKKIWIIVLVLFGSIGITKSIASENDFNTSDAPVCVEVYGVTGYLERNAVKLYNSNSYQVTVVWTVYGYLIGQNDQREVAAGSMSLDAGGGETTFASFDRSDYTSLSLKLRVMKCD